MVNRLIMAKKLQKDSKFLKHDLDGDGIVTDEEIARDSKLFKESQK